MSAAEIDHAEAEAWASLAELAFALGAVVVRPGRVVDLSDLGTADPLGFDPDRTGTPAPLTSWRAVAAAVGVDEDTVHRWRSRSGDSAPPMFEDTDGARRWWRRIRYGAPRERTPNPPRSPRSTPHRGHVGGTTLDDLRRK